MPEALQVPYQGAIFYPNPATTNLHDVAEHFPVVCEAVGIDLETQIIVPIHDKAQPSHIQRYVPEIGRTLVYSSGGDGTVNLVISAIIGHVANDPATTLANAKTHHELLPNILFVAGAGGNARNFALSELGVASYDPDLLAWLGCAGLLGVAYHTPIEYKIKEKDKTVSATGIFTTSFGLGLPAITAIALEQKKSSYSALDDKQRLKAELGLLWDTMIDAPPFAVRLSYRQGHHRKDRVIQNATGLALLYSQLYAKGGQAPESVNITGRTGQLITARHHEPRPLQMATSLGRLASLRTGQYIRRPVDFDSTELDIKITSDKPILLETDGEVMPDRTLACGQTLTLRHSGFDVPILVQL